ncbi:MAG TPA: SusC/RagA family TonB-linked outer membrane protein, partial [Gemmatimonadaceae bacterium]
RKLPFNITRVDATDLEKVASTDPLQALQGKVPGANIVSASGRPGAPPAVILRAPTSISSAGRGVAPLYVIDGIVLGDQLPGTGGGGLGGVNPQDIEAIEVIKGAAAASLYGARAGNGVISITTKSGKSSPDGFSVSSRSELGSSDIEHTFKIAQLQSLRMDPTATRFCINSTGYTGTSCARTIDYASEVARINGNSDPVALGPYTFPFDPGSGYGNSAALRNAYQIDKWPGVNYDAISQFVQPKPYKSQDVELRGKSGPNSLFASGSYVNQGGAIRYLTGFQRATARLNASHVTNAWSFDFTSAFSHDTKDGYQEEDGGTAFFRLTRVPPISNLESTDAMGRLFIRTNLQGGGSQNFNPLYELQNYAQSTATNRFIGGTTAQWRPLSWATMEFNFSYDGTAATDIFYQNKGYRSTDGAGTTPVYAGFLRRDAEGQTQYNASTNLTLTHTFLADLNSRTSFRYLFDRTDYDLNRLQGNWLAVYGLPNAANIGPTPSGTPSQTITSSLTSVRGLGYFISQDFDWKDRYILGGLVRRDASSLFGAGHRWSTFGRGSAAWRVSQEPWWFIPALDELKLRASVGSAGNRPRFLAQYETFNLTNGQVGSGVTLGNKNLRPETVVETELGIDGQLFHKVGFSITSSKSNAKDQILVVPLASYVGAASQYQNAGTLQGKSFEASVNIPWITTTDFSYSTRISYDRSKSVITRLDIPAFTFGASAQNTDKLFIARQGEVFGTFYGRQFITSCGQLPSAVATSCGSGKDFQKNSDGYVVWTGAGNSVNDGITKNLWQARLPNNSPFFSTAVKGDAAHFNPGVAVNYGTPLVVRDSTGTGLVLPLGQALPKYRWSVSQNASYKRLSVSALLDAVKGRNVYNQGLGWSYLDFLAGQDDQAGATVASAKPLGYYYRAPENGGIGGLYDQLGPNSAVVEDASFVKLRELSVGLHIGSLASLGGDWSVSLTGRNLKTWTKYTGFDPEVGFGSVAGTGGSAGNSAGSAAINAVDAFQFPNLRTFTVSVSTNF